MTTCIASMKASLLATLGVCLLSVSPANAADKDSEASVCFGTTANGKLENGWKLPASGGNYTSYSRTGRMLGRTFVHSDVYRVVTDAYAALYEALPERVFVYGETGFRDGGRFKPHKTHQNGLSVDFMVPVLDEDGVSVELPTSVFNKWGYDLEFDSNGVLDELTIDYEALAEHLYQLHKAAEKHGVGIWRVIFDPELQPFLHQTRRWEYLRENLTFSTRRSWVRHDDHYHVDFALSCEDMS